MPVDPNNLPEKPASLGVNPQITDSVTQVNTKVVGETPAMAMGNLMMSTSQALANAAHNATHNQQQAGITMQAATVQGVNSLMSTGSAVVARSAEEILRHRNRRIKPVPKPEV